MSYPVIALRAECFHTLLSGESINIAALAAVRIDGALADNQVAPQVFMAKRSNQIRGGLFDLRWNADQLAKILKSNLADRWKDIPEACAFSNAAEMRERFHHWLELEIGNNSYLKGEFVLVADGDAKELEQALRTESKQLSVHELKTVLVASGRNEQAKREELAKVQPLVLGESKYPLLAREALVIAKVAELLIHPPKPAAPSSTRGRKSEPAVATSSGGSKKKNR